MDELEISGKRFISSRHAAKLHRYHSDYIGQLIRGGKVVGQKVGRSWYVDAESLAAYLRKDSGTAAPAPVAVAAPVPEPHIEEVIAPLHEAAQDGAEADAVGTEEGARASEQTEERAILMRVEEKVEDENLVKGESTSAYKKIKISTEAETEEPEEKKDPVFERAEEPIAIKKNGLRYVADESPLMPEIAESRESAVFEPVGVQNSGSKPVGRRSGSGAAWGLMTAMVVFAVALSLSYFTFAKITIEDGQAVSSVSFVLGAK